MNLQDLHRGDVDTIEMLAEKLLQACHKARERVAGSGSSATPRKGGRKKTEKEVQAEAALKFSQWRAIRGQRKANGQ